MCIFNDPIDYGCGCCGCGRGCRGPRGPQGERGLQGPAGTSLGTYAYIYNTGSQIVNVSSDVTFSTNGTIVGDISHTAGTSSITVNEMGDYEVFFTVNGTTGSQFALFLNGLIVNGTRFGTGTNQLLGNTIIRINAGDVLTLRNSITAAPVVLGINIGGTQTVVNASISLKKIGA